ncbi:MAG TPA: hypothetical protein V6D26_22720 [Stenomitos sp.]
MNAARCQVALVDFSPPSVDLLLHSVAATFKEGAIAFPIFPQLGVFDTGAEVRLHPSVGSTKFRLTIKAKSF